MSTHHSFNVHFREVAKQNTPPESGRTKEAGAQKGRPRSQRFASGHLFLVQQTGPPGALPQAANPTLRIWLTHVCRILLTS